MTVHDQSPTRVRGLPPEHEVSDEELSGPGARESDDLGTSTGATSAEWSPSLEVHAERASDRKRILEAYERKKAKYQDLAGTLRERFGRQGWKVQVLP